MMFHLQVTLGWTKIIVVAFPGWKVLIYTS